MAGKKRKGRGTVRGGVPESFTRVRRLADRAVYDTAAIYEILDAAPICHVAHVVGGRPVATPTLHWRIGDRLYWHGSVASRMLRTNAARGEVCLTATLMDGWVLARSAFNHSANYRSVMCFGRPQPIESPEEKLRVLEAFTDHWFPGRWNALRPVNRKELGATIVMTMPLEAASAKVRTGGPGDPKKDVSWPVWAGVVPFQHGLRALVPALDLPEGLPRPRVVAPGQGGTAARAGGRRRRRA